jgi:hypothetical protein
MADGPGEETGALFGRRDEILTVGPSGDRLLAAVEQVIRSEDAEVAVQAAGPGPWTAFYHQQRLLALARPSPTGPPGAVDVSVPPAGWAATLRDQSDAGIAELRGALGRAFAGRGGPGLESVPWVVGEPAGSFAAVIGLIALVLMAISAIDGAIRRRREDVALRATGGGASVQVLRAARFEASIRESSLSIGCLGSIVVGIASFYLLALVAAWLVSVSDGLVPLATLIGLVPFGLAFVVFRWIRRRYPSPPRPSYVGWKLVVAIVGIGVAIALLFFMMALANR